MGTRTRAVFGKTKENQVIWKDIFRSGLVYFHREPTETRKNQIERPHSHNPTITDMTLTIATACSVPKKSGGRIVSDCMPKETWVCQLSSCK